MSLNQSCVGLLSANFNSDASHFSVGTSQGFKVFLVNPFKELIKKECIELNVEVPTRSEASTSPISGKGGFAIVEMLNKSNIIGLVGGGLHPKFPSNRYN